MLREGLDEKKVTEECSCYHHEYIASPLFKERQLDRVQLPIVDLISLTRVELYQLWCSECKKQALTPYIAKLAPTTTLKPKKKKTLNNLADQAPPPRPASTAIPTPILSIAPMTVPPTAALPPYLAAEG